MSHWNQFTQYFFMVKAHKYLAFFIFQLKTLLEAMSSLMHFDNCKQKCIKFYSIFQIGSIFQWISSVMFGNSSVKCAHNPVTRGDNNCTHWNDFYENKSGLVLLSVTHWNPVGVCRWKTHTNIDSKNIRCCFKRVEDSLNIL